MEVFETIRSVLAVREYQDRPVPAATIQRIIEAGWLTASAKNEQPWHFILIQDRELLQTLAANTPTGRYLAQAPFAIAVVIERTPFAVSDGSRAIQSMLLAAWDEGVGSNWVGFMGPDSLKPLLGIPDDLDLLAILPFGYPTKNIGKGRKRRKPLGDILHRERFGQKIPNKS